MRPRLRTGSHALDRFDEARAHAALDSLLFAFSLESVLSDAVLPYLRDLGDRWQVGEASVGQEHFASALLHGRLAGLARGWGGGTGPRALLACLPGERHDLGLVCFGLSLRGRGWRITYRPDTPPATIAETRDVLRPELVVLSATLAAHATGLTDELRSIADSGALALAGPAIGIDLAETVGASLLDTDPVGSLRACR